MVVIRTFIGVAALATAVLAAPTASKDMSSDCVSSGGSGCGSDMSKMDDSKMDMGSDCGGSDCGSKMDDSKKMDMGSDCGGSDCGSKMDDSKMSSDCSGSDCGGDKKMDMSSDCVSSGGSGCDSKSTMTYESTSSSTSSTSMSYATASYGSGSSNWKQYDDCVQQCVAKFGSDGSESKKGSDSGSATTTAATSTATEDTVLGSPGTNGVTHTVVVAPTQGVLRFLPFAVMNAKVGDTIKYEWHANGHTVTQGSALELCNKTKAENSFASGIHNKGTTYFQTVNTTDPTYIYCAAPTHCQKGMFGVINPKTTGDPALSMEGQMGNIMSNDNGTMAAKAYNDNLKSSSNNAQTWGNALSLEDVDPSLRGAFAQNVQLTRSLLAMNPDMPVNNGTIKLDTTKPVNWPQDLGAAVGVANDAATASASPAQNAASNPAASSSAASDSASAASASASAPSDKKNGARGLGVSGAAVAFVAVAASLLAL